MFKHKYDCSCLCPECQRHSAYLQERIYRESKKEKLNQYNKDPNLIDAIYMEDNNG